MQITYSSQTHLPHEEFNAQDQDRRTQHRFQTVLRIGRVIAECEYGRDEGLVRVRNISDQGAHLQLQIAVAVHDRLSLELTEGELIPGQVVWASGRDCGIKIVLPSGLERAGVVRWTKDNSAGVMLLDPFTTQELGSARKL